MENGRRLSLKNEAKTVSEAFGYDSLRDLETAFKDGTMGEDAEFAFKLLAAIDMLPKGAGALISALMQGIYGENMVSNKSSLVETLTNAIVDKDDRSQIEMVCMMSMMDSRLDGAKSDGMDGIGALLGMLKTMGSK